MKKTFLIAMFAMISNFCFAQITYEKGYFIDNNGNRTECMIRNNDWRDNPDKFTYKLIGSENSQTAQIENVKEFGIYNESKYERYTVDIDMSGTELSNLSQSSKPEYENKTVFLKILVEGKINLYRYNYNAIRQYFYKTEQSEITPLIYKQYYGDNNNLYENNAFRQQLLSVAQCAEVNEKSLQYTKYKTDDLIKVITNYNKSVGTEYVNFEKKTKRSHFNITIRPGVTFSKLEMTNSSIPANLDFGNKVGFRLGAEFEYILPFNKNKWAGTVEPTFEYYKGEQETGYGYTTKYKVDYRILKLPIGVRYYLFINDDSKLFINALINLNFNFGSKIKYGSKGSLDTGMHTNFSLGAGYKYKNRYSAEIRYDFNRGILDDYLYWGSKYSSLSFVLGYTLWSK